MMNEIELGKKNELKGEIESRIGLFIIKPSQTITTVHSITLGITVGGKNSRSCTSSADSPVFSFLYRE